MASARLIYVSIVVFTLIPSLSRADIINVLDFDSFDVSFPTTGGTNSSSSAVNSFRADKDNSSGTNGVRLSSTGLNVDTSGFIDIVLKFDLVTSGVLELDLSDSGGNSISGDGLIISGDVSFALSNLASSYSIPFSSAFDDGATTINSLNFLAAVNANDEVITVSNVRIEGTAVPEPSLFLAAFLMSGSIFLRRRMTDLRS